MFAARAKRAGDRCGGDPLASHAGNCGPDGDAKPGAPPAADTALGPDGLGAIAIGAPPPVSLHADAVQISETCQTYSAKDQPHLYVMTDGKVVTRITAMSSSPVQTARGIKTGASEAAVRRAYPDVREQPHEYVEAPAKYLDWRPGASKSGLRFEIDHDGRVSAIHAGREPYIEYVEGCA